MDQEPQIALTFETILRMRDQLSTVIGDELYYPC